ncbi:sugar phosphate nucleotidyltransferase [Flexivirga oryzae]|uniref:Mannose-1-phosphate guanylyltransferase n=1 Tax=Flexivirga oryzae TaxID=1794944 RepID=A0A839N3K2_9MICO|nr:mannose-1-phosphate guanylyltransferase [Flexivirga oryzae]
MDVGAIVLAGGVGSRMCPLTLDCPKPLLPLGAEPLVGYQLRRLARVGVRRVVLATGYFAHRFQDALGDGARWNLRLLHSVEEEPLGTGGALRAAVELLPGSERVIVVNGDLLSSHDLSGQLAATGTADVGLHVREVADVARYGHVMCADDGLVRGFAEKCGAGPGLANAGTYVVRADVLRSLPRGRSSWERDILPSLIRADARVVAWAGAGYFRDVGDPTAYRVASVDAVTGALPGSVPGSATAYVDERAAVAPGAVVQGGSSVHAGAVVGPRARLDATVLLPGSRVGAEATLLRCVIAAGAVVPARFEAADDVLVS